MMFRVRRLRWQACGAAAEEKLVEMTSEALRKTGEIERRVRDAGLRPTRQRVALASLLFARGDRHLSAEELHEEATAAGVPVSLATVYNALHQFTGAGLLRILAVEGAKTYFDTNTSDHHHFFVEGENRLVDIDIEKGPVTVVNLPPPPEGLEIANVDIVVRLRRKRQGKT
jgi:Fur family iron response transcriptional regulator